MDLFELDGKNYVILVDYYSNIFETNKLNKTTTQAVIDALRLPLPASRCSFENDE